MTSYIVRVKDSREPVGLFSVEDTDGLLFLVDEIMDPSDCEYAEIRSGGVVWLGNVSGKFPIDGIDWEQEERGVLEIVGQPTVSVTWQDAMTDEELVYLPLDGVANEP